MTSALVAVLGEVGTLVELQRVDRAWIFPPRFLGEVESGLVVLALRHGDRPESEEREVVTVRYEQRAGKTAPERETEVVSRGWAPSGRVPGMIDGVVRRLGEGAEEPRSRTIEGDAEQWNRFVQEVSEGMVDLANGE